MYEHYQYHNVMYSLYKTSDKDTYQGYVAPR